MIITDESTIVIQRFNYQKTHRLDTKNGQKVPKVQLGKDAVDLTAVIGQRFGAVFKMIKESPKDKIFALVKIDESQMTDFEKVFLDGDEDVSSKDNRDLKDENSSQRLSKDEIENMKDEGKGGTEIVASLIENSGTFEKKTKFSQAKFLKKKAKKYFEYLVIKRPTIRLLAQIHYKADPIKMMNLRTDSLAQLLNGTNIRSGSKVMVYESGCQGLLIAAALERIVESEGNGKLIHIFQTGNPQTQCLNAMNFPPDILANYLSTLNMYHLRSLERGQSIEQMHVAAPDNVPHRQKLREDSVKSYELMRECDMDALLIACRQHPTNILLSLVRYLAPSRPFAVFSPYKEPLLDAYVKVKETGKAIMVTLTESWLRNHQVLPDRTHPEVLMSGGGGYILSGIIVESGEPDVKKPKLE